MSADRAKRVESWLSLTAQCEQTHRYV